MRRLWFKEDMKKAILEGRKTATTRTKRLHVGEVYRAVTGPRFSAVPFAELRILTIELIDFEELYAERWKEEGFDSESHAVAWLEKNLRKYAIARELWHHTFSIIEAYTDGRAGRP